MSHCGQCHPWTGGFELFKKKKKKAEKNMQSKAVNRQHSSMLSALVASVRALTSLENGV